MKKQLLFMVIFITTINTFSQVMGVSASKLASLNATTAVKNQVEFETGFGYYWASKYFDEKMSIKEFSDTGDSTDVFQEMAFRLTYGVTDKFETGVLVAADMSSFSLGMKYNLFSVNNFSGGLIVGGTFANESDIVAKNSGIFGKTISLAGGMAFSNQISQTVSLDFDFQYQCIRDMEVNYSNDYFANAEIAWIVNNTNQIIGGFSYISNNHTHQYDGHNSQLLTLNVGASVSNGKMFEIVFYSPITIVGKNYDKLNGLNLALTIFLN